VNIRVYLWAKKKVEVCALIGVQGGRGGGIVATILSPLWGYFLIIGFHCRL